MRLLCIPILGMAAISIASAGQIEIGGTPTTGGTCLITQCSLGGLTSAYIGTANQGTWAEKTYAANLFTSDTISGSSLGGSTTPTALNGFQQFTDPTNGIDFAMMNEVTNGMNYWGSPGTTGSAAASSITVPINIFDVTNAYILLNDYYGVNGIANNDTVTFNFLHAGLVAVNLSNGNQIDSAANCTAASPNDLTAPLCNTFASTTSNAGGGSATIGTHTDVAWSASYSNSVATGGNPFSGTSGGLQLDDIAFNLSNYSTDTLLSIQITDNLNLANSSRLALSAVTVTTPEPSTVVLLLAGLGLLGIAGHRRKVRL